MHEETARQLLRKIKFAADANKEEYANAMRLAQKHYHPGLRACSCGLRAYTVMAYTVMDYTAMDYTVMAYIVMAYIVVAYIVTA